MDEEDIGQMFGAPWTPFHSLNLLSNAVDSSLDDEVCSNLRRVVEALSNEIISQLNRPHMENVHGLHPVN